MLRSVSLLSLFIICKSIGYKAPEIMEPAEVYLVIDTINMKIEAAIIAVRGEITSTTPKLVATPFPPLNPFKNIEWSCENTEIIPATIARYGDFKT